jgi:hypothetical protein
MDRKRSVLNWEGGGGTSPRAEYQTVDCSDTQYNKINFKRINYTLKRTLKTKTPLLIETALREMTQNLFVRTRTLVWAWIVIGIATCYTLGSRGSNPGRGEIFAPGQTRPGTHPPGLVYNWCRVITGGRGGGIKGRGVELTTHPYLTPRLKKVELYRYSPFVPSWHVRGRTSPLPFTSRRTGPKPYKTLQVTRRTLQLASYFENLRMLGRRVIFGNSCGEKSVLRVG